MQINRPLRTCMYACHKLKGALIDIQKRTRSSHTWTYEWPFIASERGQKVNAY